MKVYMHITTPTMRAIDDTECTHAPPTRNPIFSPLKSALANLSTCPNSPSCLVDPLEQYTRALGHLRRVECVVRSSGLRSCIVVQTLRKWWPIIQPPPDSSFDSILKVERGSLKENRIFWIFWICTIFEPPRTRGTRISETTVKLLLTKSQKVLFS